jgi:hypothetical protein
MDKWHKVAVLMHVLFGFVGVLHNVLAASDGLLFATSTCAFPCFYFVTNQIVGLPLATCEAYLKGVHGTISWNAMLSRS